MGEIKILAEFVPLEGLEIDLGVLQSEIHQIAKNHPGVNINTWVIQGTTTPGRGVRGGEEMERRDVSLEQAVRNFCIRVFEGNGHPQEVAILPQMLQYVMGHDPEVESRQNELAAKVN